MSNYTNLLRMLKTYEDGYGLYQDAAAAIEGLQAELEKKRTADCWGCKCEKLEPRRGEWIKADGLYKCSVCGELECCRGKYCPDCGAKMEVQDGQK